MNAGNHSDSWNSIVKDDSINLWYNSHYARGLWQGSALMGTDVMASRCALLNAIS